MKKDFLKTIIKEKQKEIESYKDLEIEPLRATYSFYDFLKKHTDRLQIISEIKKASPSAGDINTSVDIIKQAKIYEKSGASMISVLTDKTFFKGSFDDIKEVSKNVSIPTLNKDFIIDTKQIILARNSGATVILLILAILDDEQFKKLYDFATKLGLEVLAETHNEVELDRAGKLGAKIIGVNNRDLDTFKIDINTSLELAPKFQKDRVYISESGISSFDQAKLVSKYFNAILVGTALMESDSPSTMIDKLRVKK